MGDKNLWIILTVVLLAIIIGINHIRNEIKRKNEIEAKTVKQIRVLEPSIDDEINNLIIDGQKIKAIKIYRQATGVGLKEAKDYIDLLSEKLKN